MTLYKGVIILGVILIYFSLFLLKWFEYENKRINELLRNDDSVSLIANNDEEATL